VNNADTLSLLALWGATALYAIAMVAFAVASAGVIDARTARADVPEEATTAPARSRASGIAASAILVGVVLNGLGVVLRGVSAGHVPWTNMYGFVISGTFAAMVVFLVVRRTRDVTYLGAGVTGLVAFILGTALAQLYRSPVPLPPALESPWVGIHVPIAITASATLVLGFVASAVHLMRDARVNQRAPFTRPIFRALEAAPAPRALESLGFRLHAVGFVLWTFTVMTGAVWADSSWGRFWGWDPKEVWSFVIWVIYAAYLHARTTQGWAGRRALWLAVAGFVALVINFTVVNLVLPGLHSYGQ